MLYSRSSKLCLAGLVCALAFAGCGSGKRKDDTGTLPPTGGAGYGIFVWNIYDIEDTNYTTPFTCAETGGGSVVVTLWDPATNLSYTQDPVSCAAGQMSTADVPAGRYVVGFDLYGDPTVYGAAPVLLDSFDATGTFDIYAGMNDFRSEVAPFRVQSLVVSWAFVSGSAASYCAMVGAQYVDLDFLAEGGASWVTSRFNCVSGAGVGFPIPFGPATVQWQLVLVDAANQEIAVLPGTSVGLPPATDVNLGTQIFPF